MLEIITMRRLTCLIVTHDMAQAARLAHRAMVIENGKMTRIGWVEEVLRAERNV
jgi:ABC-type cobalamin/Fe3+-siderophores transport system ATPase subunit